MDEEYFHFHFHYYTQVQVQYVAYDHCEFIYFFMYPTRLRPSVTVK